MTFTPDVNNPPPGYAEATGPGYAPPARAAGPKVAVNWVGILMALGALVAVVGTFLPFSKFVVFQDGSTVGSTSFTGLGSMSKTGNGGLTGVSAANGGKVILVLGVLLLIAAALILARKGRLWVGIVSLVLSAFALIMCVAGLSAAKNDGKTLNASAPDGLTVHGLTKMGVDVCLIAAVILVVASVLALVLRRRATV